MNQGQDQPVGKKLWEQQPWDTTVSYNRFHTFYLAQDLPRSLNEAYRRYRTFKGHKQVAGKTAPGVWRNWYRGRDYKGDPFPDSVGWPDRAAAWDDDLLSKERAKWEDRISEQRDRDWDNAGKLHQKAAQMLQFPLAHTKREVVEDDGQTVIITEVFPARWSMRDAASILKTSSDLARLAARMETERKVVKVEDVLAGLPEEFRDGVRKALASVLWGTGDQATPHAPA